MLDTRTDVAIVVYDKLTYAGRLENLQDIQPIMPSASNSYAAISVTLLRSRR